MKTDLKDLSLAELVAYVVDRQLEISITCEPGHTELTIQPWKPYVNTCPYGYEPRETDH